MSAQLRPGGYPRSRAPDESVPPKPLPEDSVQVSTESTRQKSALPSALTSTQPRPSTGPGSTAVAKPGPKPLAVSGEQIARSAVTRQKSALPSPVASASAVPLTSPHSSGSPGDWSAKPSGEASEH